MTVAGNLSSLTRVIRQHAQSAAYSTLLLESQNVFQEVCFESNRLPAPRTTHCQYSSVQLSICPGRPRRFYSALERHESNRTRTRCYRYTVFRPWTGALRTGSSKLRPTLKHDQSRHLSKEDPKDQSRQGESYCVRSKRDAQIQRS
ncbi:uncharacterized protein LOC125501991 [Athalia rosae]|uniref:uncharacterized protein LOC125501991 n=1 Tax=Athalia rosae TaxID=37344 RepID=UPI00203353FC|nr:uncharacterized protein LOC125501991 [Athalia rosae]